MEISIKNNKQNRDKFLGEIIARGDRDEIVQTALDLVSLAEDVNVLKTQYDRANARTCASILWWSIDEMDNAKLHINLATKELTKAQMRRDRLTFLVKQYLRDGVDFKFVRSIFVKGGANA